MRSEIIEVGDFKLRAIAGTHSVMLCFDVKKAARAGLLGFAIKRKLGTEAARWLRGKKVFPSIEPNPAPAAQHSTWDYPIQSMLWADYTAKPGTLYRFEAYPVYGPVDRLDHREPIIVDVRTEVEWGDTHSVFFNRGAIASQAFAAKFGNRAPENPDDPTDPVTQWLSRGLLEACLHYVDAAQPGEALRVAAYEFTYAPIILALKRAIQRGVDVLVVHEAGSATEKGVTKPTSATTSAAKALAKHKFPADRLIKRRNRENIPHNKFIIHLNSVGSPISVWTGSTNFTESGFLGQANVGHVVHDTEVATCFLDYWKALSTDPLADELQPKLEVLTPDPVAILGDGVTCLFSPRNSSRMLKWYGDQISAAQQVVMFTGAFGVNETLANAFAIDRDFLRYLVLEKPPTRKTQALLGANGDKDIIVVPGQVLGEVWAVNDKGEATMRRPIPGFELEKWFLHEELFRKKGNIFFVHLKIMIIDALSDSPQVFTGSANFSDNSLKTNDENMLLIKGDTRVADIYLTEYDRILRHFYFRNFAAKGEEASDAGKAIFLDETDGWVRPYYVGVGLKARRQKLFFS
jgi:phosphatidylserine/phosphatidylglycerophosphate/cardiolipin synthase-like enzyme